MPAIPVVVFTHLSLQEKVTLVESLIFFKPGTCIRYFRRYLFSSRLISGQTFLLYGLGFVPGGLVCPLVVGSTYFLFTYKWLLTF